MLPDPTTTNAHAFYTPGTALSVLVAAYLLQMVSYSKS
jgi:hypothetical protein